MERRFLPRIPRGCFRTIAALLAVCLCCFCVPAVAVPGQLAAASSEPAWREASLARIVSALQEREPRHELSEKTRAKLRILSDRQVRIAAALADRIGQEDPAAVAETAYLLLTLLIILS